MPRLPDGTYQLPSGYYVMIGDDVLPSQHNPPLEDIEAALSGSIARSGAGSMDGPFDMNFNNINNVGQVSGPGVMSIGDFRSSTDGKLVTTSRVWDEAASVDLGNKSGALILDFSAFLGLVRVRATGNIVLGTPVNAKPGQTVLIEFYQDNVGGRTISKNASWVTVEGSAIGWNTAANARNLLLATVLHDGKVFVHLTAGDVK